MRQRSASPPARSRRSTASTSEERRGRAGREGRVCFRRATGIARGPTRLSRLRAADEKITYIGNLKCTGRTPWPIDS